MKKAIYGILIALAMLVPTRTLELGKLKPVEVVKIDRSGEDIIIETDTGDRGRGQSVEEAIQDLKETTAGTVYLDTAAYVLLPQSESLPKELIPYLKGNVRLCYWEGEIDPESCAQYLDVHRPAVTLNRYKEGMLLQTLTGENGRFRFAEKIAKSSKKPLDKE